MSKEIISFIEKERTNLIESFKKSKYTIKFIVEFIPIVSFTSHNYKQIDPDSFKSKVTEFCNKNNIKLKKIKMYDCFSDYYSYIIIKGSKLDYIKLFDYLDSKFSQWITLY